MKFIEELAERFNGVENVPHKIVGCFLYDAVHDGIINTDEMSVVTRKAAEYIVDHHLKLGVQFDVDDVIQEIIEGYNGLVDSPTYVGDFGRDNDVLYFGSEDNLRQIGCANVIKSTTGYVSLIDHTVDEIVASFPDHDVVVSKDDVCLLKRMKMEEQ